MKTQTPRAKLIVTGDLPTGSELIERLKSSPFYQTYQNAFRAATGLPLILVSADQSQFNPCHASANQNPFCRALNTGSSPCSACVMAQECALQGAVDRANNIECFAGMRETAIPLRLGNRTVGYLKTGQVFTHRPDSDSVSRVEASLREQGRDRGEIRKLVQLYQATPLLEKEQYASMVTLLSAFGLQLADLMNRILLENRKVEPESVRKAKQFILDRIDERITLESVAEHINVSTYYFCKIFKRSTGMTFTEYVNRQRVEMAKRELMKPDRRVTEIAYDVGFQSLSQFNRSFLKIVGESPSEFRKLMNSGVADVLVA